MNDRSICVLRIPKSDDIQNLVTLMHDSDFGRTTKMRELNHGVDVKSSKGMVDKSKTGQAPAGIPNDQTVGQPDLFN